MDSNDPAYHAAPLRHLVKQVLHKDTDLPARVRALRHRRRKAKQPAGQVQEVVS